MKTICIAGRVGKDAQLRRTQNGDAVLSFTVAVDDGFGESKRTMWFDCSLWGKRGQTLEAMLKKGKEVTVSGDLSTREHEGKTYLTVRVNDVTLQGGNAGEKPARSQRDEQPRGGSLPADLDDSIPFGPEWR